MMSIKLGFGFQNRLFKLKLSSLLLFFFFFKTQAYEVYFSPETNLDQLIVQEIQKSKKSLDISIYTFRSEPILNALVKKIEQVPDFKIRILLRRAGMDFLKEFLVPLDLALKSKSINAENIRFVTVTNHHKFLIVDGTTLINTSGNFNDTDLAATYDENLFVCSMSCPSLVESYQAEFNFLFANSNFLSLSEGTPSINSVLSEGISKDSLLDSFGKKKKLKSLSQAIFTSENFEPEFKNNKKSFKIKKNLKIGEVEKKLMQQMELAQKSIRVATGHLRSFTLAQALAKAANRGVNVEVILDGQEYISAEYQVVEDQEKADCVKKGNLFEDCVEVGFHFGRWLHDQGVHVYFKYYMAFWNFIDAPQMHHKYMIVDDKVLFTGSYNWSKNAEFRTFENKAIIKDKSVVNKYLKNFKLIKSYNQGEFSSIQNKWKHETGKISLIFSPMALTVPEIDKLRYILTEKCVGIFSKEDFKESEVPKLNQTNLSKVECQVTK
jgi:phosphatidylserine/phosphatidylglycerophosphate/cardiolipin synthase-like enzyme